LRFIALPAFVIALLYHPAHADTFGFVTTNIPTICGSVCIPGQSASDSGFFSGNLFQAQAILGPFNLSRAYANIATGAMGVEVANNYGFSRGSATHTDTWLCPDPVSCAALQIGGSFIPVTLSLHVSGSASLTPDGGFMELTYRYDARSLLSSTALGTFNFDFFEDPGFGPFQDVEGTASFTDHHTGHTIPVNVIFAANPIANSGELAFSANVTVDTFIGGCAVSNCDLSGGVFTDNQSLIAELDPANNHTNQILSSFNTFATSIASDLPFVSVDGRTAAASTPEPASMALVGAVLLAATLLRRLSRTSAL